MGLDEMNKDKASRGWLILLVSVTLILVVLVTALLFLLVINKFTAEIRMNGDETVTVEYGDTYEDPGAAAALWGSLVFTEEIPLTVRTEGRVPPLRLGSFPITYTASFGPWSASAVRTVNVVDTKAPVITLFSNTAVYTRPGQEYREEGFLAVDNFDGDITDRVEVTLGEGIVIYSVTDSSGNEAQVIRQIRYADPE